ncbi:double-stranded RNA-specific editase B2 isoform X2 [Papilio machaon]|uniref:double-stranded RNA-specific editase B2 isoform X2 n=1 Tax=Papilio machaon TaxID=76193 RepID=UPI001E662B93|nr:double-stranded RNA-specific editase B2 isoform X2 [Papilio machaon]
MPADGCCCVQGAWPSDNQDHQRRSTPFEPSRTHEVEEPKVEKPAQNNFQDEDEEMKKEEDINMSTDNTDTTRPPWMKSKLAGVKKISNKERRRRQNETLRRLLSPKNALMVLNEMLPKDQLASNFKVETVMSPNQYMKPHSYRANLTLEGNNYKGFGENKLMARNAAAEQAIRDLIIKKMSKAITNEVSGAGGAATSIGEETEEEPLPMIQLASFALHKLFCEWEVEGHKVPQLKPPTSAQLSECEFALEVESAGTRTPRGSKKPKTLPADAGAMHPCMLLTYMRPALEYRELPAQGDRPQNMIYTFALDVDGATYIGKASNKKEARRSAAQAACKALFGVEFKNSASYTS